VSDRSNAGALSISIPIDKPALAARYNVQNIVRTGAVEPNEGGMGIFGRRTLSEIEKNWLSLDLGNGGRRTIAEAAAAATRPSLLSYWMPGARRSST
jgi:hypothetical protein